MDDKREKRINKLIKKYSITRAQAIERIRVLDELYANKKINNAHREYENQLNKTFTSNIQLMYLLDQVSDRIITNRYIENSIPISPGHYEIRVAHQSTQTEDFIYNPQIKSWQKLP